MRATVASHVVVTLLILVECTGAQGSDRLDGQPGASIEMVVLLPDGAPATGATITFGEIDHCDPPETHVDGVVDARGIFRTRRAPTRRLLLVHIEHPAAQVTRRGFGMLRPGKHYDFGTVTLEPGGLVEGVVVDEHGRPIPGVEVSVGWWDLVTDDDGRFSGHVDPGEHVAEGSLGETVIARSSFTLASGTPTSVELRCAHTAVRVMQVCYEGGTPAAGIGVAVHTAEEKSFIRTRTSFAGRFTLPTSLVGPFDLSISSGASELTIPSAELHELPAVLALRRGADLEIRWLLGADDLPPRGYGIEVLEGEVSLPDDGIPFDDGIEQQMGPVAMWRDLPPGKGLRIRLHPDGLYLPPESFTVDLEAGTLTEVTVPIREIRPRTREIEIHLVDGRSRPLPHAILADYGLDWQADRNGVVRIVQEENEPYEIERPPEFSVFWARLWARGRAPIDVRADPDDPAVPVVVGAPRESTVRVRARDGAGLVHGVEATVEARDGGMVLICGTAPYYQDETANYEGLGPRCETLGGTVWVSRLRVCEYSIVIRTADGFRRTVEVTPLPESQLNRDVEVPDLFELEIRVRDDEGVPLIGAEVDLCGSNDTGSQSVTEQRTDERGRARFPLRMRGEYRIWVQGPGAVGGCYRRRVTGTSVLTIEVQND